MMLLEWLQHPYAVTLIRWLLAIMFLVSGASKLSNRKRFIYIVLSYKILPKHLSYIFASSLPWLEVIVGMLLLVGVVTRVGAIISGLLLLSFLIAVGINLVRGRTELDCGCFGSQQGQKISTKILIRNVVLMMLSLQVAFWADGFFALDGWLFGTPTIGDDMPSVEGLLPVILVSIGFLLIYLLVKQVIVFRGHYRS